MSLSRTGAGTGAGGSTGVFTGIVRTAATAGIVAGLLLTGVQHLQVIPIIQQAEVYEAAQEAAPAAPAVHAHADGAPQGHAHPGGHEHPGAQAPAVASAGAGADDAAAHDHAGEHEAAHSHGGWEPENGVERTMYTALADVSMGVGYALLLAAILCLRGGAVGWRKGLLWGAAGYAVFFIAPSLGLPPELPGTAAAPVAARQAWWICTAFATAASLGTLVYSRNTLLKAGAVALLFVPHLVGAPQPLVHSAVAPAELVGTFITATALANAVFWLSLGGLAGWFHNKFA
jgi:cobalt transporter subunit CbtA